MSAALRSLRCGTEGLSRSLAVSGSHPLPLPPAPWASPGASHSIGCHWCEEAVCVCACVCLCKLRLTCACRRERGHVAVQSRDHVGLYGGKRDCLCPVWWQCVFLCSCDCSPKLTGHTVRESACVCACDCRARRRATEELAASCLSTAEPPHAVGGSGAASRWRCPSPTQEWFLGLEGAREGGAGQGSAPFLRDTP